MLGGPGPPGPHRPWISAPRAAGDDPLPEEEELPDDEDEPVEEDEPEEDLDEVTAAIDADLGDPDLWAEDGEDEDEGDSEGDVSELRQPDAPGGPQERTEPDDDYEDADYEDAEYEDAEYEDEPSRGGDWFDGYAPVPAPRQPPRPPGPPGPPRGPGGVPRAVVLKQRRRRRRAIIGLTAFLSATITLVGSSFVYLQYRLGQIPRVDVPTLTEDQPGQVMNVLLVGSDSRARLEGQDALQAGKGQVSGQRSDTIMVLHIDPRREQAAILSIPRDLYVPISGEGYSDRVNAAFSLGGASLLSETIQESLGITINHYVEVDFVGFKDIVDAVGGVKLYLPAWVRDFTSGLDLHEIGCVEVDGTQGLAWVRSRNFQYLLDDGLTWVDDPRGDLGRIERQQDFIRRMLKKALSSGITNPIQLNRLIGIGVRDVTLDETLSTKDITTLARRFNNLDADSVALYTLPTAPEEIEGAQVLRLLEAEAQPFLDRINGIAGTVAPAPGGPPAPGGVTTTTTTSPDESLLYPEDVEIRVLNGEGTPGAASRAAAALEAAGFEIAGTGDEEEIRRTTIRHSSDALGAAQLLDRALLGGAELVVDETITSADLVLVLGADYEGLQVGPLTPILRPSTTVTTTLGATTSTTTLEDTPTTAAPPTTLALPTLPPGEVC